MTNADKTFKISYLETHCKLISFARILRLYVSNVHLDTTQHSSPTLAYTSELTKHSNEHMYLQDNDKKDYTVEIFTKCSGFNYLENKSFFIHILSPRPYSAVSSYFAFAHIRILNLPNRILVLPIRFMCCFWT